jgi:CYTH domain-containing protein/thymidylate kinase
MSEKDIIKLVITGGPCAGKTTALSKLEEELSEKGYKVFAINESATELLSDGISKKEMTELEFQTAVMDLQLQKEKIFEEAAERCPSQKVIILCDRGVLDGKAYLTKEEFKKMLDSRKYNEVNLRDGYDAVFHLRTAADGAEDFYNLTTNRVRAESLKEAKFYDEKTAEAWTGHPHLRIIDNSTGLDEKIDRLMEEIYAFIGVPLPLEIERKFLIKMPNIADISKLISCAKIEIIQTYLCSENPDEVRRIRQRGSNGDFVYYYTVKKSITPVKRVEVERKITKEEYLSLLMEADTSLRQIKKTRYCFTWNNIYYELDIYPFWNDKAIIEIELTSEKQIVNMPNFIELIKEVTDDNKYSNYSLAKEIPR